MRLHQPVGIWLLLWPCLWAITLATHGKPPILTMALFAAGAILMRSAGCIINDITDREIDKQVERTLSRPLASGELSLTQALTLLSILLIASATIAIILGASVILWGSLSLIPVASYPWMKRISWWPQLFLGLTFNWGALMGWAAITNTVPPAAIFLYLGGVFWTLGYDTIYAHQDKIDDARIGVKSTALRLGKSSKTAITAFFVIAVLFWGISGWCAGAGNLYFSILLLVELHLLCQICFVNLDDPTSCRTVFCSNSYLGLLLFIGILMGFM